MKATFQSVITRRGIHFVYPFITAGKLFFILFLFTSTSFAQPKEPAPPQYEDNIKVFTLKFELRHNVMLVRDIELNGIRGDFIFDTGNNTSLVVNQHKFSSSLKELPKGSEGSGGTGKIDKLYTVPVDSFKLGEAVFSDFEAIAFDLNYMTKPFIFGKSFVGLIGMGILKHLDFSIDYKRKEIHFFPDTKNDFAGISIRDSVTIEIENNLIFVTTNLTEDVSHRFFIDTGAPDNTINPSFYQAHPELFEKKKKEINVQGGDGKMQKNTLVTLKEMKVGSNRFTNMETSLSESVENAVLGTCFLRQHKMLFSCSRGKLYILD